MKHNNRGSWSLIGLLVTVAIIFVAVALYFGKGGSVMTVKNDSKLVDQQSQKKTVLGKALDTAKATDCQERLRQIRLGIVNYKASNESGGNPTTLKDVGLGVAVNYFQCPISKQPYQYDPQTGTVKCPNPGHASF